MVSFVYRFIVNLLCLVLCYFCCGCGFGLFSDMVVWLVYCWCCLVNLCGYLYLFYWFDVFGIVIWVFVIDMVC